MDKKPVPRIYKTLRKHLNTLPVRFPKSFTGVELQLLMDLFTEEEAETACLLSEKFRTPEEIAAEAQETPPLVIENRLQEMAKKGSVFYREQNNTYALMPLVVGIYEFQVNRMNKDFADKIFSYGIQSFGLEYMTTSKRQSRIIPIEKSVDAKTKVPSYDELEALIRKSEGRIAVLECVCRKAKDLREDPCKATDRRELCLSLGDYADTVIRNNWGRKVSAEEALEISRENQKEGLVLQAANVQEPEFICGCCGDCCGLLGMAKFFPRPADFIVSGHLCTADSDKCISCGICVKKCPMDAIVFDKKGRIQVKEGRCIGCGACVTFCPKSALSLESRNDREAPVQTTDQLWQELKKKQRSLPEKLLIGLKGILGFKNRL
ncbi:MAG: ATP-binding protein [Spirochaetia bacterium]